MTMVKLYFIVISFIIYHKINFNDVISFIIPNKLIVIIIKINFMMNGENMYH